jgi:hypothetical protein
VAGAWQRAAGGATEPFLRLPRLSVQVHGRATTEPTPQKVKGGRGEGQGRDYTRAHVLAKIKCMYLVGYIYIYMFVCMYVCMYVCLHEILHVYGCMCVY